MVQGTSKTVSLARPNYFEDRWVPSSVLLVEVQEKTNLGAALVRSDPLASWF